MDVLAIQRHVNVFLVHRPHRRSKPADSGLPTSKSSWNEYQGDGVEYAPLFIDATTITAGKHIEACREGIEDYEYLKMLQTAVDDAIAAGSPCAASLRHSSSSRRSGFSSEAASTNTYQWTESLDRTQADAVRRQILDCW